MEFPGRDRLREHSSSQQPEQIPLSTSFGLEVPEHPAVGKALVDIQLRFDVLPRVILERLVPCIDKVDTAARPMVGTARVIAFVTGSNAVAVEGGGAVGHCRGPFTHDHPVVDVGGVRANVTTGKLTVVLGRVLVFQ